MTYLIEIRKISLELRKYESVYSLNFFLLNYQPRSSFVDVDNV